MGSGSPAAAAPPTGQTASSNNDFALVSSLIKTNKYIFRTGWVD